jgi:tetratricopeptide (TPR) repeat protein
LLGAGPVNTLARPLLEFYGLRDYEGTDEERQAENRALLLRARSALALERLLAAPSASQRAFWRAVGEFAQARWSAEPGDPAPRGRIEAALRTAPGSPTLRTLAARYFQGRALALLVRLGTPRAGAAAAELAERAEDLLREASRLAPADFEVRLAFAEDAAERLHPAALQVLAGLVRQRAGWTELPLLVSGYDLANGRFAEAAELLGRVLAADPGSVDARAGLGFLYTAAPGSRQLGDFATGLRLLEEAHRAQPENPSVLNNYAIATLLAGDPEGARALIDRAVELAPDHPGLRLTQRRIREAGAGD